MVAAIAAVVVFAVAGMAWAEEPSHATGPHQPAGTHEVQGAHQVEGHATADAAKSSTADLDAAVKAVEEAKRLLTEDKKAEALAKLDEAAKLMAKVKMAATARATETPKAAAAGESFTGTVESTKSQKRPRLVVGETHHELKAAEGADASVQQTLDKISKGEATGQYVVKGTTTTINGHSGIAVSSISKQ
jgi:hypothetical protein